MSGTATGTVVGKDGCENETFTGNETLTVCVQDTALMDAPSTTLGEQTISLKAGQTFPVKYSVNYDQEKADRLPEYGFTLSARIEDPSGKLLYINDTRTSARDDKIEVKKIYSLGLQKMSGDRRFQYGDVTAEDIETFNKHKEQISQAVREKFPWVPADFELKPVLYRSPPACGKIEDFKVPLPGNKFVRIQLTRGGYLYHAPGSEPTQETTGVYIDDTLTSSADE
ncbi:unnamed protein product [Adineta ricciae]|uniref:Uncharacterized protein n=1 Tax=Adineta ricciae TaxID=249248 RepID=A0A815Z904_ADIRI|nr:unnamed protein product [Adineta ricciae]